MHFGAREAITGHMVQGWGPCKLTGVNVFTYFNIYVIYNGEHDPTIGYTIRPWIWDCCGRTKWLLSILLSRDLFRSLRGYSPPCYYSTLMETMQKLNFYGGLDIHYITRNITLIWNMTKQQALTYKTEIRAWWRHLVKSKPRHKDK